MTELVSFVAFDAFERDFFFVQEAAQFGNGAVCAFCCTEVDRRSVQHGMQDEFVNDAAFLLDDGFGQQELFGGIGKLFAFDGDGRLKQFWLFPRPNRATIGLFPVRL